MPANAGDACSIPVRKIPWRRKWQPTTIFLPGNSMDRGAWRATVHEVAEWTQLKSLNNNNWYMCILHKGERGEKESMRKEDNFSFVQKRRFQNISFKNWNLVFQKENKILCFTCRFIGVGGDLTFFSSFPFSALLFPLI